MRKKTTVATWLTPSKKKGLDEFMLGYSSNEEDGEAVAPEKLEEKKMIADEKEAVMQEKALLLEQIAKD